MNTTKLFLRLDPYIFYMHIGIIVGKTYKDPKEFLKDFEIEAIVQDSKTMNYVKEIIENAKTLYISINLSDKLLSDEVLDKIGDLYEKITEKRIIALK